MDTETDQHFRTCIFGPFSRGVVAKDEGMGFYFTDCLRTLNDGLDGLLPSNEKTGNCQRALNCVASTLLVAYFVNKRNSNKIAMFSHSNCNINS